MSDGFVLDGWEPAPVDDDAWAEFFDLDEPFVPSTFRYNEGQPRVPAGSPDGGQWADGDGGGQGEVTSEVMASWYEQDLGDGYKSVIDERGGVLERDGEVSVVGHIENKRGEWIGSFHRNLEERDGKLVVFHESLDIEPAERGNGIATRFNAAAEAGYRKAGVAEIRLQAIGAGQYAWARAGYDWHQAANGPLNWVLRERVAYIVDKIATFGGDVGDLPDRIAAAASIDDLPTPFELSRIGYTPGAEAWPGKSGMLKGGGWNGVKYL